MANALFSNRLVRVLVRSLSLQRSGAIRSDTHPALAATAYVLTAILAFATFLINAMLSMDYILYQISALRWSGTEIV